LDFDGAIWAATAKRLRLYQTKEEKFVTIEMAARARAARVEDAMNANPQFNASAAQMTVSPLTTALYLLTLSDDSAEATPKTWIKSFFGRSSISSGGERMLLDALLMRHITEEERIPYCKGFTRPKLQKTAERLNQMVEALSQVKV
jgi:hypothetical protein